MANEVATAASGWRIREERVERVVVEALAGWAERPVALVCILPVDRSSFSAPFSSQIRHKAARGRRGPRG